MVAMAQAGKMRLVCRVLAQPDGMKTISLVISPFATRCSLSISSRWQADRRKSGP